MADIGSIVQKNKEQSHKTPLNQSKSHAKENSSLMKHGSRPIEQDTVELSPPAKRLLQSIIEERTKS